MPDMPLPYEMINIAPEGEPEALIKRYRDEALPWDHKLCGTARRLDGGYDIVVYQDGVPGHKRIPIEDRDAEYWCQRAEVENG